MINEIYDFKENKGVIPAFPKDAAVTMAYVPYQNDDSTYSKEQGFVAGTMFPILNKPFKGCGDKND